GFRLPGASLVIISEEEVFGTDRVRRRAPPLKRLDAFSLQLQDLDAGDRVVHSKHGIGLYRGLKRLSVDNVESEFLILEYRDHDKLYLPVLRTDLINTYHGFEGKEPNLDKLGGTGWVRTKRRVKKAVERLAGELLKLYAERQAAGGFAFSPPDALFREFEASFEYDETPDQAQAIEDCLMDMQDSKAMDRLICGDVGYGKTEVAIRAAFKAVQDGKQAAVLVPTTVLAQQHYLTFSKRLAPYPAAVEVLSRFRSKKEQAATIERCAGGKTDIIIGTHRLLQNDIAFKDLGLIIIDEEHRFGVRQKERLKHIKKSVDCLTLTATPIPRTLHMSLASVRDLSIISTPPADRLAIKTSVIGFDEGLIAEAIEREMKRGGQVFFVHNRIESIGGVAEFLGRAVPEARVAVAHGRMNEAALEKRMLGFVNKEYDILLSTAIIESGLDIPSANTIIINRADRFGLAELYQLRGRVGRSAHRAYAYFVCPETSRLTDDARKRIEVIQELCEPGSGFKVAAYDLEIRGAGELFGTSQSGHIAEVGFDMYTELLEEAVAELKGEPAVEEMEPEISLKVSQYIPEEYMPDARQRLNFYKRLASAASGEETVSIREELEDRFGTVPDVVENLLCLTGLKLMLKGIRAKELVQKANRLYISFKAPGGHSGHSGASGPDITEKILKLIKKDPLRFRVTPDSRLTVIMRDEANPLEEARYILKELSGGCYII
ncbi:MAG: transcription-repair coupling factor, partial [Deltaproteobacteria bacterium]|nr:transcription-repair coupling factor [Deltaproteobacteria bacterium]